MMLELKKSAGSVALYLGNLMGEGIFAHVKSVFCKEAGVKADIEKLQCMKERIQAQLADADERRFVECNSVAVWVRHLKDVDFDADDLLDYYQTYLKSSKRKRPSHHWLSPSLLTVDFNLLKRRRIGKEIADIKERLDEINKERDRLELRGPKRRILAIDGPPVLQVRSLPQVILGRNGEVDRIVDLLRQPDDGRNDASVLPLVGEAGIGKTAVARLVFEDQRIIQHFQLKIWVSVSKIADANAVTRKIIEDIINNKCDLQSLEMLQNGLSNLVRNKRFFLVLDNVLNDYLRIWETVRVPLLHGADGSKVLITTPSQNVANVMSQVPHITTIQGLGSDDCRFLFQERAFMEGQLQNLIDISNTIVDECQGSPLAVKLLGSLLHNVTEPNVWMSVMNEMQEQGQTDKAIKVSYNHLPLHLKKCLGYCSIFPVDYEFYKYDLVKLWMAEGFIQHNTSKTLETIGSEYFEYLLQMSFFQNSDSYDQSNHKYKMLSSIRGLAQPVYMYGCLNMEDQAQCRKPRYASISRLCIDDKVFNELCAYESLRTLLLHSEWTMLMPLNQALCNLFANLRCLRALDLRNSLVQELPESIGDLIHLRYINLFNTQIRRLPESICSLYNLQTLELGECYGLLELPNSMSKLVNLRHLGLHIDWDRGTDLYSMPPDIRRLTTLQTLSRFTVTPGSGCGIGELMNLDLWGELCISKLENVQTGGDAKEAKLNQKQHIEVLMLKWSEGGTNEKEVIDNLRPHSNLRNLWIENYYGTDFPSWIEDPSFTRLESLTLSSCKKCRILPHLGHLPNLKNLCIKGMDQLESMSGLPPELEKLELRNCKGLTTPPPVLQSLRDLIVEDGKDVTLKWITKLTTLSSLTISRFQELKNTSGRCFQSLTALKNLKIEKCNKLVSLDDKEDLQNLTSLNSLEILSCPELKSLPRKLPLLASLHRLEIRAVPKLTSIPVEGLPVGLQNLVINGCPLLEQRCDRGGDDWPKIEHIPILDIGS